MITDEKERVSLKIHEVETSLKQEINLVDISLSIPPDKNLVLVGDKNSGKELLLDTILKKQPISSGVIEIEGLKIDQFKQTVWRGNIGYFDHHYYLFEHLTLKDNLLIIPRINQYNVEMFEEELQQFKQYLGIRDLDLSLYPSEIELSKRCLFVYLRTILAKPKVIIIKEPFIEVDLDHELWVIEQLGKMDELSNASFVITTNHRNYISDLSNIVAIMDKGKIVQIGGYHEMVVAPVNRYVSKILTV